MCLKHEVMFLTGLPFGHSPMTADLANDSCSWNFDCFTDSRRDNFMSSGQKRALWWEAVLKVPAKNGRIRKQCQTNRGRGVCVPLKKHEIVVRYPTKSSTNSKPCFYWRRVKTAYYCKVPKFWTIMPQQPLPWVWTAWPDKNNEKMSVFEAFSADLLSIGALSTEGAPYFINNTNLFDIFGLGWKETQRIKWF